MQLFSQEVLQRIWREMQPLERDAINRAATDDIPKMNRDGTQLHASTLQMEMQRQGQKQIISQSDIVITTAQLFGRPAPQIVSKDMVESMKPGSVIVDMAVESGGNVEGSVLDQVVEINGVKIVGQGNLPGEVARNASEMYSNNLVNLLLEFWDAEATKLDLDPEDEIIQACVITRDGAVVNETIKNIYGGS